MGELIGVLVIAASALMLFALATIQIAHRFAGGHVGRLSEGLVLVELDDLSFRIVGGFTAAIAVSSQLPVLYLLASHGPALSTASVVVLALELAAATAWSAELAGVPQAVRHLYHQYAERRSLAS